ncbi:unnamed protein product [Arctogadus glacialis]
MALDVKKVPHSWAKERGEDMQQRSTGRNRTRVPGVRDWPYRGHIMKTTLFLGFGVLFWVSGVPTRIQTLKKGRYAFLKVPRLQLPNERVSFGAPSYVERGHN